MDISGNMENKIKLLNSNLYAQLVRLRERQSYKLEVTWGAVPVSCTIYGPLAQRSVQSAHNRKVIGSNPIRPTIVK